MHSMTFPSYLLASGVGGPALQSPNMNVDFRIQRQLLTLIRIAKVEKDHAVFRGLML